MERTSADREKEKESSSNRQRDGKQESGSAEPEAGTVNSLHRTVGNQAVQRLYESGEIQASLSVSQPNDPAEREAEQVSKRIIRASDPKRVSDSHGDVEISRKATTGGPTLDDGTRGQIESMTGGGKPLPPSTRSFFEPRFGRDFGDVRVHAGPKADEAARSIDAEAFTHGTDLVFRKGEYAPNSAGGKRLLAHELTHVVQQNQSPSKDRIDRKDGEQKRRGAGAKRGGAEQQTKQSDADSLKDVSPDETCKQRYGKAGGEPTSELVMDKQTLKNLGYQNNDEWVPFIKDNLKAEVKKQFADEKALLGVFSWATNFVDLLPVSDAAKVAINAAAGAVEKIAQSSIKAMIKSMEKRAINMLKTWIGDQKKEIKKWVDTQFEQLRGKQEACGPHLQRIRDQINSKWPGVSGDRNAKQRFSEAISQIKQFIKEKKQRKRRLEGMKAFVQCVRGKCGSGYRAAGLPSNEEIKKAHQDCVKQRGWSEGMSPLNEQETINIIKKGIPVEDFLGKPSWER